MVKVAVAADTDDSVFSVTTAVVVIVALADFVLDEDYIAVCVPVDVVVVAGLVIVFVVAAGVPLVVVHVDAYYLRNSL